MKQLPYRNKKQYAVAMDNYFTYSKTIVACREAGVAVVGTACVQHGWPPAELEDIKDTRFNTLYVMNDQNNYKIF